MAAVLRANPLRRAAGGYADGTDPLRRVLSAQRGELHTMQAKLESSAATADAELLAMARLAAERGVELEKIRAEMGGRGVRAEVDARLNNDLAGLRNELAASEESEVSLRWRLVEREKQLEVSEARRVEVVETVKAAHAELVALRVRCRDADQRHCQAAAQAEQQRAQVAEAVRREAAAMAAERVAVDRVTRVEAVVQAAERANAAMTAELERSDLARGSAEAARTALEERVAAAEAAREAAEASGARLHLKVVRRLAEADEALALANRVHEDSAGERRGVSLGDERRGVSLDELSLDERMGDSLGERREVSLSERLAATEAELTSTRRALAQATVELEAAALRERLHASLHISNAFPPLPMSVTPASSPPASFPSRGQHAPRPLVPLPPSALGWPISAKRTDDLGCSGGGDGGGAEASLEAICREAQDAFLAKSARAQAMAEVEIHHRRGLHGDAG